MSDLISRQAAIDKFEPWLKVRGYSEGELNMLKAVLYELRFLPSVQPEILACGEGELNVPDTNVGDMIHRQAAIDAVSDCGICIQRIVDLPSAQPERRKGRWRKGVCECGYDWAKDAPISSVPNFCPQCGADMREVDDESN